MSTWTQEIRQSVRSLLRRPSYPLTAVVTLALGIGANTALFSVADAVLLRPLPYPESERLVLVRASFAGHRPMASIAGPMLVELRRRSRQIEALEGLWTATATLEGVGDPEQLRTCWPTAGLFELLGIRPARGRDFTAEEAAPGGPPAVIVSHELWQRRFNGDPDLLGREIQLSGGSFPVVGILPPRVRLLLPGNINVAPKVDVWIPLETVSGAVLADQNPEQLWLKVIGRLAPGATLAQAQAEMHAIGRQLQEDYEVYAGTELDFHVTRLHEDLVSGVRTGLVALLGAVGFVLLIACANVANLALARAADREREVAVRSSLGAGRLSLLRYTLIENLLLGLAGGVAGLAVAAWGLDLLVALAPARLPRLEDIAIDGPTLWFTLGVSLTTALVFGLAPAVRSLRTNLVDVLRHATGGGGRTAGPRSGLRNALVVSEVALAAVLLTGAGLMMRSFARLTSVDPGFDAADRLIFDVNLPGSRYSFPDPDEQRRGAWDFHRELRRRLEALPGVEAAGAVSHLPLSGRSYTVEYWTDPEADQRATAAVQERVVTPGYFTAMGMQLLAGRSFTDADGPDDDIVVVDQKLAHILWPDAPAVGQRFKLSLGTREEWVEVVGVVEHVRHDELTEEGTEQVYLPFRRMTFNPMSYVVRSRFDPGQLAAPVRRAVHEMDPLLPVTGLRPLEAQVADATNFLRFPLVLMAVFGAVAVILAAVGLYGTLSYLVARRTREIGIRMAVGARAWEVLGLVLRQGLALSLVGVAVGLAAALSLTGFLKTLLFDVSATDPWTFTGIAGILLGVASLACWIPARRATTVDPARVLND
jgi:putative ABC transport system permease protein